MPTADGLRTRLAEYVLGEVALEDFEDWFVSSTWNVRQTGDAELQRLVFAIEGALSEYSGDHVSEAALRRSLSALAMRYSLSAAIGTPPPAITVEAMSTQPLTYQVEVGMTIVDIQPVAAFV